MMSGTQADHAPVQFHQVLRSICPLFTIVLSRLILRKSTTFVKLLALLPVVVGAIMACFGDLSWTPLGFALTLLGTVLAAFKTVITNYLQAGAASPSAGKGPAAATPAWRERPAAFTKYSSMELLAAVSPAACAYCLIFSLLSGECAPAISALFSSATSTPASSVAETALQHRGRSLQLPAHGGLLLLSLLGNGLLAFALNIVSFRTNKAAGAVAMTVLGNVKQVITVLIALVLWKASTKPLNLAGIALTLAGSAVYGFATLRARNSP